LVDVPQSPKSQSQVVGVFVELSVKLTVKLSHPLVASAEKEATGDVETGSDICSVFVHPASSVTVTLYVPLHKSVTFCAVCYV